MTYDEFRKTGTIINEFKYLKNAGYSRLVEQRRNTSANANPRFAVLSITPCFTTSRTEGQVSLVPWRT
jgi:hypothetical protein